MLISNILLNLTPLTYYNFSSSQENAGRETVSEGVDGVTEAVKGMLDSSQQKQSVPPPATQEPVLHDSSLMLNPD